MARPRSSTQKLDLLRSRIIRLEDQLRKERALTRALGCLNMSPNQDAYAVGRVKRALTMRRIANAKIEK